MPTRATRERGWGVRVSVGRVARRIAASITCSSAAQLGACALIATLSLSCGRMRTGSLPRPIRASQDEGLPFLPRHERTLHVVRALPPPAVPAHPYMAPHGGSCMHTDPFTTNTHAGPGPLGESPEVASRSMGFLGGECPTINFDQKGRLITVCVNDRRPSLLLLDPETLTVLDRRALPRRRTPLLRIRKIMDDTSGGAYFYLDQHDRAVIGTARGEIEMVAIHETDDGPKFVLEKRIDLRSALRMPDGRIDKLTSVMPDYAGNLWFAGRYGTVGLVSPDQRVRSMRLFGEEIQNAISIAPDGTYLVSDHALYRLQPDAQGVPHAVWREPYDRGTQRKVGQIHQGSGTTPTLLGNDYIAIADNAEPRMNVLVYRRTGSEPQKLCSVPVFSAGQSATENTLIGHGRSLVVENNAGYDIFRTMRGGRTSAPGITRIDLRKDDSGCDIVWQSNEIAQTSVPKLSAATGLIYVYTKRAPTPEDESDDELDAYYFTGLDFHTGKTVFRVLTGTGVRYDNNWAAIALSPSGAAYVGVLNGLVRVRDRKAAGVVPALTLAANR